MSQVGLTFWLLLVAVSTNLNYVAGFSSGPPLAPASNFDLVCNRMTPNPNNHGAPMGGNGGYFIDISPSMSEVTNGFTYVGGQTYTIRVVGTGGSTIRGFLVQARVPDNAPPAAPMLLGSFQTGTGQRTLDCDAVGASTATIAHSSNQGDASSVQFDWIAPSTGGTVDFYYTVVRIQSMHFDAQSARQEGAPPTEAPTTPGPTTTPVPTDAPTTPGPTTEPTTAGPTQPPPDNTIPPLRSPDDYRLVFSSPDGCARADCNIYIGIDTNTGNDNYLDIYLEGTAAGWVAVGFSETNDMFSADVVACNRVGGDMAALDTWNLPQSPRGSPTDTIQDVYLFTGSFVNGRISCTIAKRIAASDQFDLDLNSNLFVIYARRTTESSALMAIQTHSGAGTRDFPGIQVNPATDGTSTVVPTTQPTLAPGNPVAPQRSPEEYRLQFFQPEGCNISDCDLYIGIDTNTGDNRFLDIYMEGDAAGWVAVGFSETGNMFSADIVACNRVDDTITALDAWTLASPSRGSRTDALQDVTLFNSSFVDGRITCTVAKRIAPSDQFDLNLNRDLFVIYARHTSNSVSGPTILDSHSGGPEGMSVREATGAQVNPAQAGGTVGGDVFGRVHRPRLIRAHGALMIIAWPFLAVTAIFFALFMRPALPNGEWFQVHRALLIISLFVGAAGFILIFIALSNTNGLVNINSPTSLAHLVIGIIVMALQIANPIIAIFRCTPGGKFRWIFNLLHGILVGLVVEILALINVGLGIYIFTGPLNLSQFRGSLAPFWLYISWDVFYVVLIMVLFVVFTVSAFISSSENRKKLAPSVAQFVIPSSNKDSRDITSKGIEMDAAVADNSKKEEAPQRKPPSKDAYIRWMGFALFITVSTLVLFALIVLIGLPR